MLIGNREHATRATFVYNFGFFVAILVSEEEKKSYAERNTPYFAIRLTDTEIMDKTYLRFMVKVIGEPRPQIQLLVCSTFFPRQSNTHTHAINSMH